MLSAWSGQSSPNNLTFRWNVMIIMWLEGIWGLYTGLQWSRNKILDEFQIEPSIWISIPPVCQADFQLQLRHVEAAAKSERDKMEDRSCWWLDPENPGNAQPKPKKTCNVSEISVQKKQAYLKFGNSPSTNQPVVPYQLWKPQFHVRKVEWNLEWSSVNFIRFVFSTWSAPKEDLRSQLRHFESAASEHETAQVGETDHLFRIDGKGNQRL